ncbi:MAG: peptidase U32 family protein [Candidatus Micrarchaeia archaeon]
MALELLAPAGSPSALKAACDAGADSVYLGGRWNARVRARNFSDSELKSAFSFCHARNVKAYVALNVIAFENELEGIAKYVSDIYEWGADALIVQDLGVARIAREAAPDLPLHASTQMSVHNSKTAKLLGKLGFSRLILAREADIASANAIAENSGLEVEVFAHGALCYSYSGKCLFSYVQTGRSGNRGACAQLCRLPWKLYCGGKFVKSGYLTSTKDLSLLQQVPQIAKSRVGCLKIEGRLKDPSYVKRVVSAYRKAIDTGEASDLSGASMRGYTGGYLFGDAKRNPLTNPSAHAFSGEKIGQVVSSGRGGAQIALSGRLSVGDSIRSSSSGKVIQVFRIFQKGRQVDSATGSCALLIKTLKKGEAIYRIEKPQAWDDSFLEKIRPAAAGRKASPFAYAKYEPGFAPLPEMRMFHEWKGEPGKIVPVPLLEDGLLGIVRKIASASSYPAISMPRIMFDSETGAYGKQASEAIESGAKYVFSSEPSTMDIGPTIIDTYANLSNSYALSQWAGFGRDVRGAVASIELPGKQAAQLGMLPYFGHTIELMVSENDLPSELGIEGKSGCYLSDPRGNRFSISRMGGRTYVTCPFDPGHPIRLSRQ